MLSEGRLLYRDIRTLGCLWLVPSEGATGVKGYDNLGPDAISPDFTTDRLYDLLKGCHRPVKTLLLDQTKVAGLGNIYVDEALFRAGIRPMRRSDKVTKQEAARLHANRHHHRSPRNVGGFCQHLHPCPRSAQRAG